MDNDLVAMAILAGITINLLHEEHWYDDGDVPIGLAFAALAVPAYLAAIGARTSRHR